MQFYFTAVTVNKKTGPMPVVTASKDTCPDSCTLKDNGCYAEHGHVGMFWRKVSSGQVPTLDFEQLEGRIKSLPRQQIWRYGQAGDLPDDANLVDRLAVANRGRPVICYTHKRDYEAYRVALSKGFVINLSANSLAEADELASTGLPVVVVLPSEYGRSEGETLREYRERLGGNLGLQTPGGKKVAICPEAYLETNCLKCQACSKVRPGGTIIGFPAHGAKKRKIDIDLSISGRPNKWAPSPSKTKSTRVLFTYGSSQMSAST